MNGVINAELHITWKGDDLFIGYVNVASVYYDATQFTANRKKPWAILYKMQGIIPKPKERYLHASDARVKAEEVLKYWLDKYLLNKHK